MTGSGVAITSGSAATGAGAGSLPLPVLQVSHHTGVLVHCFISFNRNSPVQIAKRNLNEIQTNLNHAAEYITLKSSLLALPAKARHDTFSVLENFIKKLHLPVLRGQLKMSRRTLTTS